MNNNDHSVPGKLSRREFLGSSVAALGTLATFSPTFSSASTTFELQSALKTKLTVKFIVNGCIHEAAYEGSCRVGELGNLTQEAERKALQDDFIRLQNELKTVPFPPQIELLEPTAMHLWVEKGNPDIMLKDDQLNKLAQDDLKTDVYVVTGGGLPQYTGLRIAEQYHKPVILANTAGWGLDLPAGLRRYGLEGFYVPDWADLKQLLHLMAVRKSIRQTKILNVTNFPEVVPKGVVSSIVDLDFLQQKYGIGYQNVNYDEFFSEMDLTVKENTILAEAEKIASELMANANNNNMTREDIVNSLLFYFNTKKIMHKYACNAFTIECFELCSSLHPWNRRFTPCLTHALLKDAGFASACEKDLNALIAMMVEMYLARKAVYMGNPDINVKENILTIHHSVASRQLKGIEQPMTPYEITSFTQAGFGATLRYDFSQDSGEPVTVSRFDPSATKLLVSKGTVIGGSGLDGCGCAQTVNIRIPNGKQLLRKQQDFGHHLALVFGDYIDEIDLLGELMGFEVVNVS